MPTRNGHRCGNEKAQCEDDVATPGIPGTDVGSVDAGEKVVRSLDSQLGLVKHKIH